MRIVTMMMQQQNNYQYKQNFFNKKSSVTFALSGFVGSSGE